MKQIEIQLKERLLIVEDKEHGSYFPPRGVNYHIEKDGEIWELLCKGSELTEEILKSLIEPKRISSSEGEIFPDYKNKGWLYGKPNRINSFISGIEASGFHWGENTEVNPEKYNEALNDDKAWNKRRYSQEKMYLVKIPTYKQQMKIWYETELKTFNPEKTLIFKIID